MEDLNGYYDIVLPYATFAIITDKRDIVIEAAPIAAWMVGKDLETVSAWVAKKNGYFRKKVYPL